MTLKEYLEDYASPETKAAGEKLIAEMMNDIPKEKVRGIVTDRLIKISLGERDFRF
jgi:2-iminoacetate synthase